MDVTEQNYFWSELLTSTDHNDVWLTVTVVINRLIYYLELSNDVINIDNTDLRYALRYHDYLSHWTHLKEWLNSLSYIGDGKLRPGITDEVCLLWEQIISEQPPRESARRQLEHKQQHSDGDMKQQ